MHNAHSYGFNFNQAIQTIYISITFVSALWLRQITALSSATLHTIYRNPTESKE